MLRRLLLIFLLLLLPVAASAGSGHGNYVGDEIVCKMEPGFSIDSIYALFGTSVQGQLSQIDCFLLKTPSGQNPDSLATLIGNLDFVTYCRPNYFLSIPEGLQRSSPFVDQQAVGDFSLQSSALNIDLADAHALSTGAGVRIGVIDGGANMDHPEFAAYTGQIIPRWDYVDSDPIPNDEPGGIGSGHGTLVTGILRLVAPEADILVYRALDNSGRGDGYSVAAAILMAVEDGCQVINLSLGMVGIHDAIDDALRISRKNNILVVAAAGNDSSGIGAIFPYPASRDFCIAVLALDSARLKADFSNYGVKSDICAPGTDIYGPFLDSSYAWWSGTSFATPFVTGLTALLYSAQPSLTREQADEIISQTAISVDELNPEYSGLLGSGLINPVSALTLAATIGSGDVNGDGVTDVVDLTVLSAYFFNGDAYDTAGADANKDGYIDISDITGLVDHLFESGTLIESNR
ncbi:MAG: S8 family serine peptidase [bacterium]|nr:S8 family serine peptidase [bacterium]